MAENFQRTGSISNAHVGSEFEALAMEILAKKGIMLTENFSVDVGVAGVRKPHSFDLGSDNPPVIVECKSHKWTKGSNVPSAKMTVWNEAMYYFNSSPTRYRRIFFVLRDERATNGETLAQYYIRTYAHLIPENTEIWEFDEKNNDVKVVYGT